MASSLWPLMAFGAVVALIPVSLWLLRRSGLAGTGGRQGLMRTVSSLALSPSQKVVIVALGQGSQARWLVLGVSGERIDNLCTMEPLPEPRPETPALGAGAAAAATPSVAELVQRWRRPASGSGDDTAR